MDIKSIQANENPPVVAEDSEPLRNLEVRYQQLFESARDGLLVLDVATRKIIDANPSLARLTRYAREEIVGKELWEIGLFPNAVAANAALQELQEANYIYSKYLIAQVKGGGHQDVEIDGNLYEEGRRPVIQCRVRDITEHKRAETTSDAASRQIISIWESMTDAFYSLDKNWRFSYVNSQAAIQLQRSREEILGAYIWDAFPEAVGTALEREYKRAATEQVQVSFEEFYVPLQTWFAIHVYPSEAGLAVYFRDINESKRAEDARRESDAQLRTLVESIPQIVWIARPDGQELFFNQKWFDYSGLTQEGRINGGWGEAIYPDDRESVAAKWKQSLQSGEPYEIEFRLRRADGVYRWMLGRAVPLRDAEGQITQWFGTTTDIHDLKQVEEVIQQSEREQRNLAAQLATEQARLVAAQSVAKVGSWEIDFSTHREAWSAETYRILELEPHDFQPHEQAFLQFVHPDDRVMMSQVLKDSLDQEAPCTQEHRLLMPDGRVKTVEQRWQIFHDEQKKPVHAIGTIQDITERKHAQQVLEAKTHEITAIWESMTDALLTLDVNGNITHINSQAVTLLQTSREQLLGQHIWEAFPAAVGTAFYDAYQRAVTDQVKLDFEECYMPLNIWLDVHVYPSSVGVSVYFRDITERKRAQEALQRSEQSLLRAQRIAHLGYMEQDAATGQESWSDEIFRILGYEPQSLDSLKEQVSRHLHPADQEWVMQAANALYAEGIPFNIEHRVVRPSGEVRWVQAQAEAVRNEKVQIMQFSCTWLDITERKMAEEEKNRLQAEIEEQQQRLDTIVATVPGVVWETYVMSDITNQRTDFVSDYVETMLGYTVADWMETPNFGLSIMHPDDKERAQGEIEAIFAGGKGGTLQFRWIAKDGRTVWVESLIVRVDDDEGQPRGLRGVTIDITERKEVENALRESEERFQSIAANVPGMVYQLVRRPDGSLDWPFVSEGSREIYGLEPEFIRGSHFWPLEAIEDDDRSSFERSVMVSAETLTPWRWEGRYRLPGGKLKWIQGASRPQRLPDGSTLWNGLIMDVTARKEAEEQRDRFFTVSIDMMCIAGFDGYFKRLNPAFSQVLGYTQEELMARPLLEFVHPADVARTQAVIEAMLQGGPIFTMENRYRTKDGLWRWLEWKGIAIIEDGLIYAAARDVTEHKESEATLRSIRDELEVRVRERTAQLAQANEELTIRQTILESQGEASIEGILVIKHEGEIVSFNRRFIEMWGIEPEIAATRSDAVVLQSVLDKLQDPTSFIANVNYHYAHRSERSQEEIALKDGRVFDRYSAPIEGANGSIYGRIWFFRDVTERKQFEVSIRQAKEEAERANLAKSEFLSRMSHELRTPLNAILGFGQILEMRNGKADSRQLENIQQILKAARHLLDLINEVLDIARVEAGHLELSLEPVALADIVSDACDLMKTLAAQRHIHLDTMLVGLERNYIMADRQRLKQVLINLIANAIKYNHTGGQVEVFCKPKADHWISIAVRDTGPGISSQDLAKLFTPFERLNASASEVEGTGLGLVLSQRLVTAIGGKLSVESTVGVGTTFTIDLPQTDSPGEKIAKMLHDPLVVSADQEPEHTYSVLCIEDNFSNLQLMETIFTMRPEIVLLTAIQGSTGVDMARQYQPDLILLDLNLPDMHGSEVLTRLQQLSITRDIPVVIVSADATPDQVERLLAVGAKAYLTKPFDLGGFWKTVDSFIHVS